MAIYVGTTTTLPISLDVDWDNVMESTTTFLQNSRVLFKINKSRTVYDAFNQVFSVTLLQTEALKLNALYTLYIQIKIKYKNGDVVVTNVMDEIVKETLDKEEI